MRTIDINTQCNTAVTLGIRGENEVTEVRFDYSDWVSEFGNGVVMLLAKRSEDASPYPVALTYDGNVAVWTVTETDTAYNGRGQAEWLYYIGEQLAKSLVVKTYVVKDIGVELTPPDPYETWLDTLTELAAQTQTNAETAKGYKEQAESILEQCQSILNQIIAMDIPDIYVVDNKLVVKERSTNG